MSNKAPTEGLDGRKIVYDEDGKPCRSCNTLLDFKFATGKITGMINPLVQTPTQSPDNATPIIPNHKTYAKIDPPDVEKLGRSSWDLLHSITARYPVKPTEQNKTEMKQFLTLFSHVYPCSWCATDFEKFIAKHAPKVNSRDELGRWMCEAHNEVNAKLMKEQFDCNLWDKRWKDGWDN